MRETEKIKLGDKEIEICLKMEDGEEETNLDMNVSKENLEDTIELNFEDLDE